MQPIVRNHVLKYESIWSQFAVNRASLSLMQFKAIVSLYLSTLYLYLPNIKINREEREDSDDDDKVFIRQHPIDCFSFVRKIIQINGIRVPVTLQLIGVPNRFFLGIKLVVFNTDTTSESGVFLCIDQKNWLLHDSQKQYVKKTKLSKDSLVENYSLPKFIQQNGMELILNKLEIKTDLV